MLPSSSHLDRKDSHAVPAKERIKWFQQQGFHARRHLRQLRLQAQLSMKVEFLVAQAVGSRQLNGRTRHAKSKLAECDLTVIQAKTSPQFRDSASCVCVLGLAQAASAETFELLANLRIRKLSAAHAKLSVETKAVYDFTRPGRQIEFRL